MNLCLSDKGNLLCSAVVGRPDTDEFVILVARLSNSIHRCSHCRVTACDRVESVHPISDTQCMVGAQGVSTDTVMDLRLLLADNVSTCHYTSYSFSHEVSSHKPARLPRARV